MPRGIYDRSHLKRREPSDKPQAASGRGVPKLHRKGNHAPAPAPAAAMAADVQQNMAAIGMPMVAVTPATHGFLTRVAEVMGVSVSDVVERSVHHFIVANLTGAGR